MAPGSKKEPARIREGSMRAGIEQIVELTPLVKQLWPEHPAEELTKILEAYIGGAESAVFAEYRNGKPIGAALCCLRHDYVEGCETSPVGYLEGIFVCEAFRTQGVARTLCRECECWAKEKGCTEFASDCELTNTDSLHFHLSIGFMEENRIICFRKMI